LLAVAALVAWALSGAAQTPQTPEVATQESSPNFSLRVERNLVVVRVVVRDSAGNPRANFTKDDFLLFDDGRQQAITHFAVERAFPEGRKAAEGTPEHGAPPPGAIERAPQPLRFLALYFDDVHMNFEQIVRTRDAAQRYLQKVVTAGDRVGIFTSSGYKGVDFTHDPAKIQETLATLLPRPVVQQGLDPCPNISDYQAYLITDHRDANPLEYATREVLNCQFENNPRMYTQAKQAAESEAYRRINQAEVESEYSLRKMDQVVRRLSFLPGQRTLLLISPGFLTITLQAHMDRIVDRALRSNVIINTLEARGLDASPAMPLGDATERGFVPLTNPGLPPPPSDLVAAKVQWVNEAYIIRDDALAEFAGSTGGVFFQNNNSMDQGFERAGSFPSVYYTLAFSPSNLKSDGKFHTLKVKLVRPASLEVEARRGYFAPSKTTATADMSAAEVEDAVFSQDDVSNFPAEVETQYFRVREDDAQLAVLTHVDLRFARFRKEAGRNANDLTVVVAVFDADGNLVSAKEKRLELRLRDETLVRVLQTGLTMKTSFNVKPGSYVVRQVVRDDAELSALSRAVDISF
jgi:VWFA-related protein